MRQFGRLQSLRNLLGQNSFWLQRPDLNRRSSLVAAFPDVVPALTFLSSGQFLPRVAYANDDFFWCTPGALCLQMT